MKAPSSSSRIANTLGLIRPVFARGHLRIPLAPAALVLCSFAAVPAPASPVAVVPFAASPDYVSEGVLVGAKSGTRRAVITTQFTGEPAVTTRPLSVRPDSSLNGEVATRGTARPGPRALPPVFGGFTAIIYSMKEPAPYTTRIQFHNGADTRNDFLNLNVYLESKQIQPAGLEFSFTGALLFPAGDGGAPGVVPVSKIARASFYTTSQRQLARLVRVLVRDSDGGDFYVSESFSTENHATVSLAGGKWAKIDPADLTVLGEYRPAPFQRIDHIGVHATIPVTENGDSTQAFGVICNVTLQSFEYTLSP
jgi:hypothetical protein